MIVNMMKHFYIFIIVRCLLVAVAVLSQLCSCGMRFCVGFGGSFRMPNPINIDVEFDLVLAANSEFGY